MQLFYPNGTFAGKFGTAGTGDGRFNGPSSAAYSMSGDLIAVADSAGRVQVFYANGTFVKAFGSFGTGDGHLSAPGSAAFVAPPEIPPPPPQPRRSLETGMILVTEHGNNRIQAFHANGTFAFKFGGPAAGPGSGNGQFNRPMSVAAFADPSGGYRIAVADMYNNRVQLFNDYDNGTFVKAFGVRGYEPYQFRYPVSVAWTPNGSHITVADYENHRIHMWHADGTFDFKRGWKGNTAGLFDTPRSVAWSPDGTRLAVADAFNHRVQLFDAAVNHVKSFGGPPRGSADGEFNTPRSVAWSPDGTRLAVADRGNNRVQLFDAAGNYVDKFGEPGSANGAFLSNPTSVAYSPDGSMIAVADRGNNRVQMFHANGTFAFSFGSPGAGPSDAPGKLNAPITAAFVPPPSASRPGMIAVADRDNHRIQVFNPDGTFVFAFGGPGTAPGKLNSPQSVAYTPDGNIVVADTGNDRIQVFSPDGSPLLNIDYDNLYGPFLEPRGVDVDSVTGRILVADARGHRVQIFNPDGTGGRSIGGLGGFYGQFYRPVSVDWSPDGDRFAVAEITNARLQFFYPNGTVERGFRDLAAGTRYNLHSVDYSPDGTRLAVISSHDNCVTVMGIYGDINARLGCSASSFSTAMTLAWPRSVAWSEDGTRLAVADTGNNRVQVFGVDGSFEVTVGLSGAVGSADGQFNRPVSVAYHPSP